VTVTWRLIVAGSAVLHRVSGRPLLPEGQCLFACAWSLPPVVGRLWPRLLFPIRVAHLPASFNTLVHW